VTQDRAVGRSGGAQAFLGKLLKLAGDFLVQTLGCDLPAQFCMREKARGYCKRRRHAFAFEVWNSAHGVFYAGKSETRALSQINQPQSSGTGG
jgi:hypothetical protein